MFSIITIFENIKNEFSQPVKATKDMSLKINLDCTVFNLTLIKNLLHFFRYEFAMYRNLLRRFSTTGVVYGRDAYFGMVASASNQQ